ncbi:unnamed protein product [Diatraea saccharalis]|uniref:CCHC-type domain-containing protein n=1 Tax=Diatraea saccharalis TaxID=40085 RepID=A0A9N9R8U3_9NEOP|nr:unnamed protein product [Diatraea saccharalis]
MYPIPASQSPPMSQSTINYQHKPTSSYASVTSSTCFPKKDQAIVLDSIDGITLREYIIALSSIIPATCIRFISRISNARICIYLDTKKTADKLLDENKKINIKEHILEIKPLITRNKRIVLSNVCPVIPNYVIEQKFHELNIQIMSPITFMKIGVTDPGFSHILSFRRQLYVSPEDNTRLPESFQLTFEGTNYWIYVSTDALKCFTCNTEGHLSKNCPQNTTTSQSYQQQSESQTTQEIKKIFERNDDTIITEPVINIQNTYEFITPSQTNLKGKKRLHSPTTSNSSNVEVIKQCAQKDHHVSLDIDTDESSSNVSQDDMEIKIKTKKKLKKIDPRTEEEVWNEIRDSITELSNEEILPISLDQFISLLDNSRGKQNIKELVYSYTENIKDLIIMCNTLHSKMNKSLKKRCSRLSRKLHELLNHNSIVTSETDK